MKGFVDIELKNPKTGEVVKKIKDHNLVTNFFQEFFRELGPTKGLPFEYGIENMLGGVLLFEDQIEADADNVILPSGNKMIGNASTGYVNGPGTNVSELGSYVASECKWNGNEYQQQWQWSSGQAVGTIKCICLTHKTWGFIGEGNSTSGGSFFNSNYKTRNSDYGNETWIALNSSRPYTLLERQGNILNELYSFSFGSSADNAANSGKIIIRKTYFPFDEVEFRYGNKNSLKIIETQNLDIPENIRADYLGSYKYSRGTFTSDGSNRYFGGELSPYMTRDSDGAHWCSTISSLNASNKNIFCFHYHNGELSAEKIVMPDAVWNALRGSSSSVSYSDFIFVCNKNVLLVFRTYVKDYRTAYLIKISDMTVTEIHLPDLQSVYDIFGYHDGTWYFSTIYNKNSTSYYPPFKIDTISKRASWMNGYSFYQSSTDRGYQFMPDADFKLATLMGNGRVYERFDKYLATIYNLPSPVTKTADLELTITYTISFDEEE